MDKLTEAQRMNIMLGDGEMAVAAKEKAEIPGCPGFCTTPCGSLFCNTLLVNQIQPWPSIQCPHCARWVMGPKKLEAIFQYLQNPDLWPISRMVICPECQGRTKVTRHLRPEYTAEKLEGDNGD